MNPSASVLSLTPSLPIAQTVRSPLSAAAGLTAGAWLADAPGAADPPPPWFVPQPTRARATIATALSRSSLPPAPGRFSGMLGLSDMSALLLGASARHRSRLGPLVGRAASRGGGQTGHVALASDASDPALR